MPRNLIRNLSVALIFLLTLPNMVLAQAAEGTPSGKPGPVATLSTNVHSGSDINWDVNWTGPTNNGGSAITGYTISILKTSDSSTVMSCTTDNTVNTCLVTGLTYKTSYIARAFATNINGNGTITDTAPFTTSSQSQTWTTEPVDTTKNYGAADFQLVAVASSGLPVTWSSTSGCTVDSSGVVHIVSSAGCTITYTQNGIGSPYNAISGSKNITVNANTSTSMTSATDIQATQATLNGSFVYGGQNISPQFCVSTSNTISTSCSGVGTVGSYTLSTVTNLTSSNVSATVTGLTSGVTYYAWTIANPSGGSAVASSTSVSFTTTTGPSLSLSGTPTAAVGTAITLTFTATGGSGIYPVWDHGTLPTGFTFTPGVTVATISGTGSAVSSTATWVSVSDSNSLSATQSTTIEITAAATPPSGGGGGGGGSGGGSSLTPQTISNNEPPSPGYLTTPTFNLNGAASSGLSVTYLSSTPSICTVSATGIVTLLAPGLCSITISQAGNNQYAPAAKNIIINVAAKLAIVLEEFVNVQSTSATVVATAEWPGLDADVSFCISTVNSKATCDLPAGIEISAVKPTNLTALSGPTFTAEINGLEPSTNYYVWAVEKAGVESVSSEIRKLHTPVGPTIKFTGNTIYKVGDPGKIVFHAIGGASGYNNWKITGMPTGVTCVVSTLKTFTCAGNFPKSGNYQIVVTVKDKNGITGTISLSIIVTDPENSNLNAPGNVTSQVISKGSTKVGWALVSGASNYTVRVGKIITCETDSPYCNISQLLGPKSQISVTANFPGNKHSIPSLATYRSPISPIPLVNVNFPLNIALLQSKDKVTIQKFSKLLLTQGFTSLQVSGYTDAQGNASINTPLSKARATNTYKYLQNLLTLTALSVTLQAKGSADPVASNATKEGQAANRRAVIYLK